MKFDARKGGSYPDTITKGGVTYHIRPELQWSQMSYQMHGSQSTEIGSGVYDWRSGKRIEVPAFTGRSGESGEFKSGAPRDLRNKKFTVRGGVIYVQEEAEMVVDYMSDVKNYSHKVIISEDDGGIPIYATDEDDAKRIAGFYEGAEIVENEDTDWPDVMKVVAEESEPQFEAMLPWHGDPLVEEW